MVSLSQQMRKITSSKLVTLLLNKVADQSFESCQPLVRWSALTDTYTHSNHRQQEAPNTTYPAAYLVLLPRSSRSLYIASYNFFRLLWNVHETNILKWANRVSEIIVEQSPKIKPGTEWNGCCFLPSTNLHPQQKRPLLESWHHVDDVLPSGVWRTVPVHSIISEIYRSLTIKIQTCGSLEELLWTSH